MMNGDWAGAELVVEDTSTGMPTLDELIDLGGPNFTANVHHVDEEVILDFLRRGITKSVDRRTHEGDPPYLTCTVELPIGKVHLYGGGEAC